MQKKREVPHGAGDLMSKRHPRKCHATSKQTGQPCGQWAIPGGTVCKFHGGGAPQTKQAAAERLRALVDPALTRLSDLLESELDAVSLAAVRDVLDRNGYKTKDVIDVRATVAPSTDYSHLSPEQLRELLAEMRALRARYLTQGDQTGDSSQENQEEK